jgi:hypothetical protein
LAQQHFKSNIRVITLEMNLGKGGVTRPTLLVYVCRTHLEVQEMYEWTLIVLGGTIDK